MSICYSFDGFIDSFTDHELLKSSSLSHQDFVSFCDLRGICPVTCDVRDVNFYFTYTCRRSQSSGSLYHKLYIVSRIHDSVEGFGELYSHPEVCFLNFHFIVIC